ncbi:MAG: LamG domain-containing protein [Verrucomicrobiota bacterium]
MKYICALCCLFVFVLTPVTHASEIGQGLLFYLSGEQGDARADTAQGMMDKQSGSAEQVAGKAGQALKPGPDNLSFQQAGNLNHAHGTLAFWSNLDVSVDGEEPNYFSAIHFVIKHLKGKARIVFMTGKDLPGQGFKWDYGAQSALKGAQPGWNHFAFTWDAISGQRHIYFNGNLISESTTDRIRSTVNDSKATMTIGNKSGSTSFPFDEFAIWDRRLSTDEIMKLVTEPGVLQGKGSSSKESEISYL